MNLRRLELPDLIVVEPDVHRDDRGFFLESFHAKRYAEAGIDRAFVQDNHSRSTRGTLRGLHAQIRRPQAKLVRVTAGRVLDVAVDIRRGSPTFGRHSAIELSADDFRQLFIPEGFAHGFLVLSDVAEVQYKTTDYYDPGGEITILWNDPEIAIAWPETAPALSAKDAAGLRLSEAAKQLPTDLE